MRWPHPPARARGNQAYCHVGGRVGVRNPPPHTVARRTLAPRAPWTQAPPCAPVHMIAFLTVCTAKGWVAWPSHGPPPRKWHTQVTTNPNAQLCARPTHGGPHARLWRHCTPTPEPQAPYHLGNRTPIHSRLPPAGLRPSLTTLYTVYTPRLAPLLPPPLRDSVVLAVCVELLCTLLGRWR